LIVSASLLMDAVLSYPEFYDFAWWLEGLPHGWPHMNFGYSMMMMNSPDDPAFMLHHCNIDRIYSLWQDCYDHETITKELMTSTHYTTDGWEPINPYSDLPYSLGLDSSMPYAFAASGYGSTAKPIYSVVFPSTWPTPRDLFPSINGYKGLDVRYGPDAMVAAFGSSCTQNVNGWTVVNYGVSTKRDTNGDDHLEDHKIQRERLERETKAGKKHHEVIKAMAMEDCEAAPKVKLTPKLLEWIRMNGLDIEQFNTICDKVSERAESNKDLNNNQDDLTEQGKRTVPLWVIITASIGSTILLIAIVTLIVLYLRKRNEVDNGKAYTEMRE